jgi:hypothetical protein
MAEVKATCWALVTKLLKVLIQEVHRARMFAAELGNNQDYNTRVNGLFLYATLKKLRVLREFASHEYRHHPKYNQCIVLHLFNTSLPQSVYKKRADGTGRDTLHFTRMETTLMKHKLALERLESAVGLICMHLNMPASAAWNRRKGGKGAAAEVAELE